MRLTHIRLLVKDLGACFRFYRDVMGFKVIWGAEDSDYASFRAGGDAQLALFGRAEQAAAVGAGDLPADAVCQDRAMLIFEVDDLEARVARLQAQGVHLAMGIADHPDWGIRTAYVRDPDGTLIEFNVPIAREAWSADLREQAERYDHSQE